MVGVLGTIVIIGCFALSPPESLLLQKKQCSVVLAQTQSNAVISGRLHDGVILNIMDAVVE
jgi:hypothetical protein